MVAALGVMMFAPMVVDYRFGDRSWQTFGLSAILTTMMGAVMAVSAYTPSPNLGARGAFLLTVLSWVMLSFFAAIPFLMDPMKLSFTDAMFEATSGITTTGATILTGLDDMPKGVLLWRAILQWIGGVGIVVTAMAVLPMLKVGGMQLFRLESSDMGEKILPRAASLADLSMGGFMDGGADIVCVAFMMLGALPFGVYLAMGSGALTAPFKDPQVRAFIVVILILIAIVTIGLSVTSDMETSRLLSYELLLFILCNLCCNRCAAFVDWT